MVENVPAIRNKACRRGWRAARRQADRLHIVSITLSLLAVFSYRFSSWVGSSAAVRESRHLAAPSWSRRSSRSPDADALQPAPPQPEARGRGRFSQWLERRFNALRVVTTTRSRGSFGTVHDRAVMLATVAVSGLLYITVPGALPPTKTPGAHQRVLRRGRRISLSRR